MVADAGLLSNENIKALEKKGYQYIIGARVKNETERIKKKIIERQLSDGQMMSIKKQDATRLIITYATNRAVKDEHNRSRGLQRLEKRIKSDKLTKSSINNKGYNKYLKLEGDVTIVDMPTKLTTSRRFKLTTFCRSKLTTSFVYLQERSFPCFD